MWDSRWSRVGCSARCLDSACPVCGLNLLQFQLMLLEVVPLGLMQLRAGSCSIAQIAQGSEFQTHGERRSSITCQFARVVKGVDLRCTAGNCAWVRTPQLTFKHLELQPAIRACVQNRVCSFAPELSMVCLPTSACMNDAFGYVAGAMSRCRLHAPGHSCRHMMLLQDASLNSSVVDTQSPESGN